MRSRKKITPKPSQPLAITSALSGLGKEVWKQLGGGEAYLKKEQADWDKKTD